MSLSQEVTALRKDGRIEEAYAKGYEFLEANPNDEYLKTAVGWVLYEKVKGIVSQAKHASFSDKTSSETLRNILRMYAKLKLPRPDLLFSLLLSQVIQFPLEELAFFPKFMMWAGIDSFRPEDFCEQTTDNGKRYESLVEKTARAVGKISRGLTKEDFFDIREVQTFAVHLIDFAVSEASLQKPELLDYHKALLLHSLGELEQAKETLLPFVRKKRNEFWAWQALADVVAEISPDEATNLYVKACLSCRDEAFAVNVFESLSSLAVSQNKFSLSKWAAYKAFQIRDQKGWSISPSLSRLLESAWYSDDSIPSLTEDALERMALDAERFIQIGLPVYDANYIGSFTNKKGRRITKFGAVIDNVPQELTTAKKTPHMDRPDTLGCPVKLTVDSNQKHLHIIAVTQRPSGTPFDSMQRRSGQFRLHPRGFGFIGDVYIPHEIADQIEDGHHASVAVVRKRDKKKNQWGLTAIAIVEQPAK